MYQQLHQLIDNIKGSDEITESITPIELMDAFASYNTPALGKLVLGFRKDNLQFDRHYSRPRSAGEAFYLAKGADQLSDQVVYSLCFLGLFNHAAYNNVRSFIKQLTDQEVY